MTCAVQNDRMFPIAQIDTHNQMRRSLVGALATDPVMPESLRRTRRSTRAHAAHVTPTTHTNEGAQTA